MHRAAPSGTRLDATACLGCEGGHHKGGPESEKGVKGPSPVF